MATAAEKAGEDRKRVRGLTAVPRYFTLGEVAQRLGGVQRRRVRRWVEAGEFPNAIEIPSRRDGERGSYQIPEGDVVAFCERRRLSRKAPNAPDAPHS
jgi:hypothetical protein